MVLNRHTPKIIVVLMLVAVTFCMVVTAYAGTIEEMTGGSSITQEYETKLFDKSDIISINIKMDEDDWNEMLENALSEDYYVCDVEVNGQEFKQVGIRPKGNTSLSSIANDPDTDRYSLKLEFDHYVSGQTCFGLDKLILNNNYGDATNMKEAIIYDMYEYLDVDASLYNYAKVSLNDEYWGVYLALEGVEDSFMLRNYGTQDGELYKPDSMEVGGDIPSVPKGAGRSSDSDNKGRDFTPPADFDPSKQREDQTANSGDSSSDTGENTGSERPQMRDRGNGGGSGMGGGPGMGGNESKNGADLNYSDDDLDSYSTIWDGEITDTGKTDHKRVVKALKNISEGTDIEKYMDVDNILKYMAVHVFSVNLDSLSGNMTHNYYLYESDGQLNLFPWDYNLAFGGMSMGQDVDGTSMINDAIDTPFDSTDFFDALLSNEEYLNKYHEYLRILVEEYVNGGRFEETYNRIRSQIDELVGTDPTAFYNGDEYDAAAEMLFKTVTLRAESILGQLEGTIPSTDDGQKADPSSLIDGSDIDIKTMGQMKMGQNH